jgi:hypothetical protein
MYHERQRVLKCGVHAVNNLLGEPAFSAADFETFSQLVSPESLWTRLGVGNYDVNVLEMALKQRGLVVTWFDNRRSFCEAKLDDDCVGLVLNRVSDAWMASLFGMRHWISVRRHKDAWFNCDSLLREPQRLSRTELNALVSAAVHEHDGYCLLVKRDE